ncbi:MAG: peptidyl-alpha-hydroxyglycine alpha-amidating lyase family protein [Pseudomonadota bacterium]
MTADERPIVAINGARYEVHRDWGKLPSSIAWGFISQVAVDSTNSVYVLQRANPPVLVFNPDGTYARSIGDNDILDGHGITIDSADRVWLVDRDAHQVIAFTPGGDRIFSLGQRGEPREGAPFNHPTSVAVADDGQIYVADGYGNTRVHHFNPDGELIRSWGTAGSGPGEFSTPHGVMVSQCDEVLVIDRENHRVQRFARDGTYLGEWGTFHNPMAICQDRAGILLITDQVPRIHALAPDGTRLGRCRGAINGAHGISVAADGNIYLAELPPARLTKLSRL